MFFGGESCGRVRAPRPTSCDKVGCRAACPQAAGEVGGNEKPYLKNRFDGPEGARRQIELLDAQSLRLAAKAEALRIQQAYVSLKSLYWRAIAEGHEDEANRILEENKDVIENVKKQPGKGAIAR